MIFATTTAELESPVLDDVDLKAQPRSVANPRRTVWTGFAKDDRDRLPAS